MHPDDDKDQLSNNLLKYICSFKDDYLLDFINIEELDEQEEDINERVIENENIKQKLDSFKNINK